MSISSSSARPSPIAGRVGIRDFTFEACSGFTHVTARPVAQPPKAAFVTRLRSGQLPSQTARQLPDLSTIIWMDSSSIGYPCLFRDNVCCRGYLVEDFEMQSVLPLQRNHNSDVHTECTHFRTHRRSRLGTCLSPPTPGGPGQAKTTRKMKAKSAGI